MTAVLDANTAKKVSLTAQSPDTRAPVPGVYIVLVVSRSHPHLLTISLSHGLITYYKQDCVACDGRDDDHDTCREDGGET